jgi:hypothetical protein
MSSDRFQPSPGFTSPWFELAGQLEGFKYRDSDIRDGYAASTSASVGKYFTDRIRKEAGAGIERRGGGKYDGDALRIGYLLRFR